jgi:hypothetical protein
MSGRAPREKGDRFERACVSDLCAKGLDAHRIPLSGAAGGGYSHDLRLAVGGRTLKVECKARKRAWSDLFGWLQPNGSGSRPDLLLVKADRTDTLVVMTLDDFARLVAPDPWSID